MKNDVKSEKLKKISIILTLVCVVSNIPLFAFILYGPKEGMEELAILFPWFLAVAVHIVLVIPAILFARHSHGGRGNFWIYLYFILFFGFHIIFLAHTSGLDTRFQKKINSFNHPDQVELHKILSELRYDQSDKKIARAKELILKGVDVNAMIPGDNESALQKAAFGGCSEIVGLLLEKGAKVSGPPKASETPLAWAVKQNHTEAVKLLLDSGADPNKAGYRFLRIAVEHQNLEMVTALLNAGADPNKRMYRPERPLMTAALKGYTPILKKLIEGGANVDFQLPDGETALVVAVKKGNLECVDALLNAGAKLTGHDYRNTGLLALSVINGNPEIMTLIEKAVKLRIHSNNDEESFYRNSYRDLFNALNENRLNDFKMMLQIGILADSTNDRGNSMLQVFCSGSLLKYYKHLKTIDAAKILIENGADINRQFKDGTTLLMSAVRTGQIDMVRLLIDNGAQINTKNKLGHSALYYANSTKNKAITDLLLSLGAK